MSQSFNDVTTDNFSLLSSKIVAILAEATFIAIDTEFTGLGEKHDNVRAPNIEERYQNLVKVVKSHALSAIGLTAFKKTHSDASSSTWRVDNFNILLSLQASYTVSHQSLRFLADSGFDFNKQIRKGLPYTAGADAEANPDTVRYLFRHMLYEVNRLKIPIVIHNGLMDLMYLYYSMYTDLPANLLIFAADLSDMFPGGIIDTKYISDYVSKEPVSFLSYLYKKYEREQKRRKIAKDNEEDANPKEKFVRRHIIVDVQPPIPIDTLNLNELKRTLNSTSGESEGNLSTKAKKRRRRNQRVSTQEEKPYCEQYALHGYCKQNKKCGKSHDLDFILDEMEKSSGKKTTGQTLDIVKGADVVVTPPDMTDEIVMPAPPPAPEPAYYHSAHFDSFMTGYIFAHQLQEFRDYNVHSNKLYLMGKDIPLPIQKSAFSKLSKGWLDLKSEIEKTHGQ
ncbi:hypothetical protein INT43_005988 [Umbelopsis isabellina]|uniref:C3H1-type domain-containing protein n=1 Tax=Mortierella isabellina TaxID=91625 RepID=A0A8H7PJ80_MORIS|nr:hypothetical protein INT43_005988 [Umbelopsis isabellina]